MLSAALMTIVLVKVKHWYTHVWHILVLRTQQRFMEILSQKMHSESVSVHCHGIVCFRK